MDNIITRSAAVAQGLSHYFTGKPCKHGHISRRRVTDLHCLECQRLHSLANKEINNKRCKDWYEANKEYALVESDKWKKNNPEKRKAIVHKYIKTHPEEVKRNSAVQAAKPHNKLRHRLNSHKRRAKTIYVDVLDLDKIWNNSAGLCYLCGNFVNKGTEHYDHVIALGRGGSHVENNVKVTHDSCNLRKHTKTPVEYWQYLVNLDEANAFQLQVLNN